MAREIISIQYEWRSCSLSRGIIYSVFYEIVATIISIWKRAKWPAESITRPARDSSVNAVVDQGAEAGAAALAA
ncbi:hypothetical protein [Paraburkholderia ferrariae]|uniref:hypothetical protein n=1 Tax=Paraburkholderia ferrariae TaxID=386056 RepID=UPI00319EA93B